VRQVLREFGPVRPMQLAAWGSSFHEEREEDPAEN
jgi:hypothetical protein